MTTSPSTPDLGAGRNSGLELRSELLRACLPGGEGATSARRRTLIWVNTLCGLVLGVGLVGGRDPEAYGMRPARTSETSPTVLPVLFEPPPPSSATQSMGQETGGDALSGESPSTPDLRVAEVVEVVPLALVDQVFAVPVEGPTIEASSVALASAPPASAPVPSPAPSDGPQVFQPRAGVRDGGHYPDPGYPRDAELRREQGRVQVLIEVGEDGRVVRVDVRVPSGSGSLDRHTVAHVRRFWRFPPGPVRQYLWTAEYVLR
jgi:TonB family protein